MTLILGKLTNDSLEISVDQVNSFKMYNSKSFNDDFLNIINIVTKDELEDYLKKISKEIVDFYINYNDEINLITNNHPKNSIQ